MDPNDDKLKTFRGQAQRRVDEICAAVLDSSEIREPSLTQILVKAYRHGHDPAKAGEVFHALRALIADAEATYLAAIAQPEPKVSTKSRVVL